MTRIEPLDVGGETVEVHHIDSGRPGRTLAVIAGVHGDELEGIVALRLFAAGLDPNALRGRLRLVTVANPPAHRALSRTSPVDGANLARVFPGAADGSVSSRIAYALTRDVIAGADLFVDLHSAGQHYEMPLFAGYYAGQPAGPASAAAAFAFGAPVVWRHDRIGPGRTIGAAADLGVPAMYAEGTGGGGLRGSDVDAYVSGLRRLLVLLEMSEEHFGPPEPPLVIEEGDGNVDSSLTCGVAGLCVTRTPVGVAVAEGALLAEIVDERGAVAEQVRSPVDGRVMMLRRTAPVAAGDGIAMLAPARAAADRPPSHIPPRPA